MAIVRRHGFSNDQWVIEGMNLLSLRYDAGLFSADASEIVRPNGCPTGPWWINRALTALPRGRFDYVWMIDPHPFDPALTWGMEPVWSGANSILFRIDPDAAARPGARPRTAAEPERQVRSQRRKRRATRR
jgi:hypothetical protein